MFHFEHATLRNILRRAGFELIKDHSDGYNLVFLAKKTQLQENLTRENMVSKQDIDSYGRLLIQNRENLKSVAAKINSDENVAIYGSGRILDALIKYGELKASNFVIADKFLWEHAGDLGIEIRNPESVNWSKFEKVVVLARSSEKEISDWLTAKGVKAIIKLENLWGN